MYFPCSALIYDKINEIRNLLLFQIGPATAVVAAPQQPDLSLPLRPNSRTTSAPTSPAKSRESLLQRVSSLTSNVVSNVSRVTSSQIQQQQQQTTESGKLPYNKDRCFTLLVIDDQNTDWYDIGPSAYAWINQHAFSFCPSEIIFLSHTSSWIDEGRSISEEDGFTATGMSEWSRRNSVNYPSRPQPTTGPLFPWPFTAAAPKSSGAFLANSPLLLRQFVSKWPAKLNFFPFLGVPRLFSFSQIFLFVGDTSQRVRKSFRVWVWQWWNLE